MRRRRFMTIGSWLVALALLAAACTGSEDSSDTTESGGLMTAEVPVEDAATRAAATETTEAMADETTDTTGAAEASATGDGAEAPATGNGAVQPVTRPVDLGRDIIFAADMTVAVSDVAEAGAQASRVIERFGGFLFGQQTTGGSTPRTILTFKVFPEDFQDVLAELGSIGEVRNQNVSATDVTERVVDLRSRITTAEASVVRLRELLDNAQDLETIASLENQLLERETNLETLRGQLRTLENQVGLATIVVTLTEARVAPGILVESSFYPGHDDGGFACPGTAHSSVETGDDVTACFFITNTGDTPLVDLTLVDSVLGITIDDLTPVSGDPRAILLPGESIMLSHEFTADAHIRTRTTATGTPADPEGEQLDESPVASTVTSTVEAVDPGGITSFTDGLAESWQLLFTLGRMALLVLAWVLPFAWLIPVGWWLRRRSLRRPRPTPPPAEVAVKTPEPV